MGRKRYTILVCLVFLVMSAAAGTADAYSVVQATAVSSPKGLIAPEPPEKPSMPKVKYKTIVKCKRVPIDPRYGAVRGMRSSAWLPPAAGKKWEFDAQVIFARTKGQLRNMVGNFGSFGRDFQDVDMNSDLGLPDHHAVPDFTVSYRFRPNWAMRYSIMPIEISGSGSPGRTFTFGNANFTTGQNTNIKWQRTYQRVGLVYDPIQTYRARVRISGEYVRVDDTINVSQATTTGSTMSNELNMGMAGIEFEKALRSTRLRNVLSLQCKAGVAFMDEAFGSDLSTGLKYSIPMGKQRSGYIEGGYRFVTFKKNYSDVRQIDTAIEGGYLQMGFVF